LAWERFFNNLLGFDVPTTDEVVQQYNVQKYIEEQGEAAEEAGQNSLGSEDMICGVTFYVDRSHQARINVVWCPEEDMNRTASRLGQLVADVTNGEFNEVIYKTLVDVVLGQPDLKDFVKQIIVSWQDTENLSVHQPVINAQSTLKKFAQDAEHTKD